MSATFCAFILTFSTLCGSRVVSGVLNGPRNVRLTSYNMDLVLRWDPPEGAPSGLVYTTEYNTSVTQFKPGCVDISSLECDFTGLNHPVHSISEHGRYTGKVQAQLGQERSAWVESNQILLDKDTVIGSPNVTLFSNGATIEVSIKDPVLKFSTIRNIYNHGTYNITYWKDGQKEKAKNISGIQQNRAVLSDLDDWTMYCVQVQIDTERISNLSKLSEAVCERTTEKEEAPWVAAVVTFVVLAVVVTLVVVAVVRRKSISHFLCPKDALPQYLIATPNSSMYVAIRNSHPPKEFYDQVCIVPDDQTVEEERPPEAAGSNCSKDSVISVG